MIQFIEPIKYVLHAVKNLPFSHIVARKQGKVTTLFVNIFSNLAHILYITKDKNRKKHYN